MMEERHEIVTFPRNKKIRVFMHSIGSVSRHWHRSMELLFLIKGEAGLRVDGRAFTMAPGDVTLINSNSIHELNSGGGAVFVAVQIKPEMFDEYAPDGAQLEFDCVSALSEDQSRFDHLRMCIARMIIEGVRHRASTNYRNYGLGYWLLAQLVESFRVPSSDQSAARQRYAQRLSDITAYVEEHYAKGISLAGLADLLGLSVPYLSGFFAKYMGVKFTQYCNDVKLGHAMHELVETDHAIERVAANNGFAEVHSFIRVFKQKYGETPSVYRQRQQEKGPASSLPSAINYLAVEPSNYFGLLQDYAKGSSLMSSAPPTQVPFDVEAPPLDVSAVQRTLRHTFKNVITVGRAHDILSHDIRKMLRDIQENIGFRYIKFHGILADDMMVCSRAQDGSVQFQFHMVDSVIDFLLSIGLKPLIQLSFMPTVLASDPNKTIFFNPFNTSPPRDMGEWNLLIESLVRHLISRFGLREVLSWPFTVWSEPDTPSNMFGFVNQSDFFALYENTWRTVKSVCQDLQFGTPGVLYMHHCGEPEWIRSFFRFVKSSGCEPDFINLHYYSDILPTDQPALRLNCAPSSRLPREDNDFAGFIAASKKLFRQLGFAGKPLFLTEWNLTFSHRNLISDTCYKSCYIMKNLLENYDALESFGYWSLTDLLEENPLPDSTLLFHGGLGIYTMSGVRKSVFYAFDFANRLGDELIARGDGYFVTRGRDGIQIITYNYVHYGDLFASGDNAGVTEAERYAPFDMSRFLRISVPLTNLPPGEYVLRERFVNRDYGSAFDLWVRAGGLPLSSEDIKSYAGMCVPALHGEQLTISSGSYTYTPTLAPLEIRLAVLTPQTVMIPQSKTKIPICTVSRDLPD